MCDDFFFVFSKTEWNKILFPLFFETCVYPRLSRAVEGLFLSTLVFPVLDRHALDRPRCKILFRELLRLETDRKFSCPLLLLFYLI